MKNAITELEQKDKITQLCFEIEAATDRNDHTGAVCLLAEYVGGNYPQIAKAIQTIHEKIGHMPPTLSQFRQELKSEMLFILSEKLPVAQYFSIKSSF